MSSRIPGLLNLFFLFICMINLMAVLNFRYYNHLLPYYINKKEDRRMYHCIVNGKTDLVGDLRY
jgi:hypothetical protein